MEGWPWLLAGVCLYYKRLEMLAPYQGLLSSVKSFVYTNMVGFKEILNCRIGFHGQCNYFQATYPNL